MHNWRENWKVDLMGPFHLFYLRPECFDQMMIYSSYSFLWSPQQVFFLLLSTHHHRGTMFCGGSEGVVGGIVFYTHTHATPHYSCIMALHDFDSLFCALGRTLLLILII